VDLRVPLISMMVSSLAACAAAPARAPAPASAGMVSIPLALGQISSGGEPLARVMPAYPASLRESCPARQEVEVRVSVDASGAVSDVRGIAVDAFPPPWNTFYAAVHPAVLQWRFEPLRIGHWAADAQGNTHVVDEQRHPFMRIYRFEFDCRARVTRVSVAPEGRVLAH
jgi:hypothetical protein